MAGMRAVMLSGVSVFGVMLKDVTYVIGFRYFTMFISRSPSRMRVVFAAAERALSSDLCCHSFVTSRSGSGGPL